MNALYTELKNIAPMKTNK